jgi:hypothetical protein
MMGSLDLIGRHNNPPTGYPPFSININGTVNLSTFYMIDTEKRELELKQLAQNQDLEKTDPAVQSSQDTVDNIPPEESRSSREDNIAGDGNDEAFSQPPTNLVEDDPFALFPTLSITMSSTRGTWVRRNTASTLGRQLTRAETLQTIKTVRSRFAEARSEFDENVSLSVRLMTLLVGRYT